MKTALALGVGAIALYAGYKLFLAPRPAAATSPGSASSIAAANMTLQAARNTVVGGITAARGFLAPLAPQTPEARANTNTWARTLRSVLTAANTETPPAPAPNTDMYTVVGVRGTEGQGVSGQAFPPNPGTPGACSCRSDGFIGCYCGGSA
jgi:hypothetical protein